MDNLKTLYTLTDHSSLDYPFLVAPSVSLMFMYIEHLHICVSDSIRIYPEC
jgi:hypothetical protein